MRTEFKKWLVIPAIFGLLACTNQTASASVIFTGSDISQQLSASATFTDLGGGQLEVILANTYTGDTVDQGHVLTGVFFSGTSVLTPVSATAPNGSTNWVAGTPSVPAGSAVLGTEWAYGTGPATNGATEGIVSAGYYTPGFGNFAGPGDMLDGSAYGLLSVGYAGSHLDGLDSRDYIQNAMDFILNYSGSINLNAISNVSFQYGTAATDLNLIPVPEPAPIALLAVSLGLLGFLRARARKI